MTEDECMQKIDINTKKNIAQQSKFQGRAWCFFGLEALNIYYNIMYLIVS